MELLPQGRHITNQLHHRSVQRPLEPASHISAAFAMLRIVAMTSGAEVLSLSSKDFEADAGADAPITVRCLKEPGLQCLGCCYYLRFRLRA